MKIKLFVLMLLVAMLLSSCYINQDVNANQVGIQMKRNAIGAIVGPGVYTDWGWFSDLRQMDVNTQTFQVTDPEVLTSDNQIVGVAITIQARRKSDEASVKNILTNWSTLVNNQILMDTISATAKEGIKNGTRIFTLTGLLDDRNGLADKIRGQLETDCAKYSVEIINVTIENIAINTSYAQTLNEKAQFKVETEKEKQRQDLISQVASNGILQAQMDVKVKEQELLSTEAQTAIDVAIAKREGLKIAEKNAIYKLNPQAFELERLRLMKELFGNNTTYFVQPGIDLSLIFGMGANAQVVPVQ